MSLDSDRPADLSLPLVSVCRLECGDSGLQSVEAFSLYRHGAEQHAGVYLQTSDVYLQTSDAYLQTSDVYLQTGDVHLQMSTPTEI